MMGNNLEALNTAKSISKQLAARKQRLSKTNDRQNEVNVSRKRANSESTGSDYGVTRYTHLAAHGRHLKETFGSSTVNDSRNHLGLATSVDNTSSDWNDNSFVYYSPGKSNKGAQESRPKLYPPEDKREKRTAIDQLTKSVANSKCPVVVDLTLDDSDDDDDNVGSSAGVDGGRVFDEVVGPGSKGRSINNISGVCRKVGVSGISEVAVSGVGIIDESDSRIGVNRGNRSVASDVVSGGVDGCGRGGVISKGVGGGSRPGCGVGIGAGVGSRNVSKGVGVSDGSRAVSGAGIDAGGGSRSVSKGVGGGAGNRVVNAAVSGAGTMGSGSRRVGDSVEAKGCGVSSNGADTTSQEQPSTLPKILAAYSLNLKCSSSPELCLLLNQKAKENVVRQNGIVVNGTAAILPKGPNPDMVTEPPLKNGTITQPKLDFFINNNQSLSEPITDRNDVMNDVTNLPNGDSSTKKQMVFSNWSVKHDSNLDSIRRDQGGSDSPTDTEDQVIITKVVTSAEKSCGRKQHPRKTPVEVRKLYFEEKARVMETPSTTSERDEEKKYRKKKSRGANKSVDRPEKRTLEETIASLNGNVHGTPWSFTMKPDNSYRENKIQTLKDRLAQQQEAVEKLRTKEKPVSSSRPNGGNRMLVVQISDLKTKLGIQTEKKQSFRVMDQIVAFENLGSANKRKRKTLPRKVNHEDQYDSNDNSDKSHRPRKRSRARTEKDRTKQRLPKRPRGRSNSPVVREVEQIVPVVSKDLWHREMEKVEAEIASSNRQMDKTAFLLFLGLKKVEAL